MKYEVIVSEYACYRLIVEAKDKEEAEEKAENMDLTPETMTNGEVEIDEVNLLED